MKLQLSIPDEVWSNMYGRTNCKHGNTCVHCLPIYCTILDFDELGRLVKIKMRFEQTLKT